MSNNEDTIKRLSARLEILKAQHANFSEDIQLLQRDIALLKSGVVTDNVATSEVVRSIIDTASSVKPKPLSQPAAVSKEPPTQSLKDKFLPVGKSNLEKFIGENLINKIGILITLLGVAIGAKYSIDNNLISPLLRIILGYVMGIGLLGFGMKLKNNYESYSAVLVSGAISILYLMTYLGYSMYGLFPQVFAFGLMVVFTAFTVYTALQYNKQIIALLGLVGAYAVPFLLSTGSGRVDILFSYMLIVNIGILIISIKKYWISIFYSAFIMTWIIFGLWLATDYREDIHFTLAFTFLFLFFLVFYLTFIGYKFINKKKFEVSDVVIMLFNSFLFYGLGYFLLSEKESTEYLVGVFTLVNAFIHFLVSYLIYREKLADKSIFYLISGLVLVFITIAIPVQLDGNWVTLLWAGEAAVLFWVGRAKGISIYEKLSYPLILLTLLSLWHDWGLFYFENIYLFGTDAFHPITPILNLQFLNTLLVILAFSFVLFTGFKKEYYLDKLDYKAFNRIISVVLAGLIFSVFFIEIYTYWELQIVGDKLQIPFGIDSFREIGNYDLKYFRNIWLVNYVVLFAGVLSVINCTKVKSELLGKVTLSINMLAIVLFLSVGLLGISELRENYINAVQDEYFSHGWFNIGIRYVSILLVAGLLFQSYSHIEKSFFTENYQKVFDIVLHITIVWVLSSELLSIMNFNGTTYNYKLGLSILWGVYSLAIIAYGIWKSNAFLRIGAIGLFGLTLLKVFLYDISHLDTIAKTIVFVSLGVLLLIISFLYNKYKHKIAYEGEE